MSAAVSSSAIPKRVSPPTRLRRMLTSLVGLKLTMALTGVILSGFVLVHMLGNLQAFQPRHDGVYPIDAYGKLLRVEPALLWTFRLILLAAVALHIWAFFHLKRANLAARPQAYQSLKHRESTFASRSMTLTGPLILLFIIFHILHMTTGTVHPAFEEGGVYHNLVTGLGGIVGLIYIAAMIALAFHLWHGVWSMFQTLGAPQARYDSLGRRFSTVFTVLVTLGFCAVPLAVMTGYLTIH